jgi:predicted hydrocarbon binding protein
MTTLLSITDVLAEKYPNIMGCLKEFSHQLEESEEKSAILYEIGEIVGNKVALNKYKSVKIDDSIAIALKKIVLPAISPFALAKIKENELHLSLCPFCIDIKHAVTKVQCDFLTGFISGLIGTKMSVKVEEVQCRAQKNPACVFLVSKKY